MSGVVVGPEDGGAGHRPCIDACARQQDRKGGRVAAGGAVEGRVYMWSLAMAGEKKMRSGEGGKRVGYLSVLG